MKITDAQSQETNNNNESYSRKRFANSEKNDGSNKEALDAHQNENYNSSVESPVLSGSPITRRSTSTPRKNKRTLALLHSTLSPKYIGYSISPTTTMSTDGAAAPKRSTRLRSQILYDSFDGKQNDVGSVANTSGVMHAAEVNSVSPEVITARKSYMSPIDKLLIKNGSISPTNTGFEADSEEVGTLHARKTSKRKMKRSSKHRTDFHKEMAEYVANSEKTIKSEHTNSSESRNKVSETSESKNISSYDNDIMADNTFTSDADVEKSELGNVENAAEKSESFATSFAADKEENLTTDLNLHFNLNSDLENVEKLASELMAVGNEFFAKELNSVDLIFNKKDDESMPAALIKSESDEAAVFLSPMGESNVTLSQIKPTQSHPTPEETLDGKITPDIFVKLANIKQETTLKSPSSFSIDSAKGSSITNDSGWSTYQTGDLFWGQIYTYSYWPCMVCPDPEGKTMNPGTAQSRKSIDQTFTVHVRFFADNGRRNWVKQENLIPYVGSKAYQDHCDEIRNKYGSKSSKYKLLYPKRNKVKIWHDAINEANRVAEFSYTERLEKFYEIFENSKSFQKKQRKRRESMQIPGESNSDIGSFYDSTDNIYAKQTLALAKRERSVSPFSPIYSPVKSNALSAKRRKVSNEDDIELSEMLSATAEHGGDEQHESFDTTMLPVQHSSSSQDANDPFVNGEFKNLYLAMREFVMGQNQDEKVERCLVQTVRHIWSLKLLNRRQMERHFAKSSKEHVLGSSVVEGVRGEGSVKRLSNRLKNILIRRSLTPVTIPTTMMTPGTKADDLRMAETAKPRKQLNRPIEEVIDDIFNLDSKYLFKGIGREPVCKYCFRPGGQLRRCSKNCQTWLHTDCIGKTRTVRSSKTQSKSIKKHSISAIEDQTIVGESSTNENIKSVISSTSDEQELVHITTETLTEIDQVVICDECSKNAPPKCCICQCEHRTSSIASSSSSPSGTLETSEKLVTCNMPHCNKIFHPSCCKYWPQAKLSKSTVRCPSHVCHTCVSDDPKGKFQHISNTKLTKCVKCPASYHTDSTCIPAGSQILTAAHIICPRHTNAKSDTHVNVNWCFICVRGGQVTCCETCPIAVHAQCLNIPIDTNDIYICEECESGRMPLYGEMVWAKFNSFRWWPAIILPPPEVPANIAKKPHGASDFVVRFFGTHDHGWITRRRVYLYLEGDSSEPPRTKSQLDQNYINGVEEAKRIYEIVKTKKLKQLISNESKEKLHPQPYVKIKANRAVPPVKLSFDLEKVSKCECKPDDENGPCGPDSNCLNRVLYHECNPKLCPAGKLCQNQMFESRISPRLEVVYMRERGFGLVTREPISAGTFVIEYVGEIINDDEFRQRMSQKTLDRDENFYFLSVEKDYIIDAGPKGNLARFMNHSCEPNCETQKWSVNALNRVGLFAIKDIKADTELTFNYHWDELLGSERKTCHCGAPKCAGQIGGKYKEDNTKYQMEQTNKKVVKTSKNKNAKPLKRLQNKKSKTLKTNVKISTTAKSISPEKIIKIKKHISADDVIEHMAEE